MQQSSERPGRIRALAGRPALVAAVAAGAVVVLWAPSLVATRYAEGTPSSDFLTRPDRGWAFLYDAVTESRGARLGSPPGALRAAQEVWAGPPAVAQSVRLAHLPVRWTVPVPRGGGRPAPGRRVAEPRSPLTWVVTGPVGSGPPQVIGLVDYHSGRVVWDIRPLASN